MLSIFIFQLLLVFISFAASVPLDGASDQVANSLSPRMFLEGESQKRKKEEFEYESESGARLNRPRIPPGNPLGGPLGSPLGASTFSDVKAEGFALEEKDGRSFGRN
ncbi:hypothetical protein O181_050006 [Austropuccinia psidii MF-1]|uniref:Uncharacterized protein n=1 Tax=Austropuccinia psidii MF-1 TaxID=1389203 RepID=A0A9Q3E108_9BASI|nr:hypothetical protein [Austropuccinia psidii MF-1]